MISVEGSFFTQAVFTYTLESENVIIDLYWYSLEESEVEQDRIIREAVELPWIDEKLDAISTI